MNKKTAVNVEQKLIRSLQNKKIIYCADARLGSASIRLFNDLYVIEPLLLHNLLKSYLKNYNLKFLMILIINYYLITLQKLLKK